MIRNTGVSHGAQEDRVERPQLLDTVWGHHVSGLNISFATPVERVPVEAESEAVSCRVQHPNAFRHHFFSDAIACDDRDVESFHEAIYPFSTASNGESTPTSLANSKALTKAMISSALVLGQCAYSAHPRNFEAASSNVIGSAGLPLAKSARPVITLPSFKWIFRIDVILSKPALSASGST